MKQDFLFKLTNGVYRVTNLFPKEEPLKFKIREMALEIFTDFISASPNPGVKTLEEVTPQICSSIDIITGLFDLSEACGWVNSKNFSVLREGYDKVKQYLQNHNLTENQPLLGSRKEKIREFLNSNGGAPTREILEFLGGGMSKRTLRRELGELVRDGAIERMGRCNQIYYKTLQKTEIS
ncbi:MAG: hypothetical protein A2172_02785 [Candidatus Woykebacteria bacterium RBG_13_40_15]|uniref:HTH deoR-type domain-containing protein n=1 Tax=Candidatus Woykebacteria bacterium RBG_13_40_15 TaxID=1802593 RepID=A0A1G1W8F5_9BACT|nr:MAG: hypothetical protein A2172_02785 [Candidatus Woykebacteria bacterium RBG_13_40_15]